MGKRRLKKILINGCSHSEKMYPSQEYHEREITKKYNKLINMDSRGFTSTEDWLKYINDKGKSFDWNNLKTNFYNNNNSHTQLATPEELMIANNLLIDWGQHFYFYNKLVLNQNTSSYSHGIHHSPIPIYLDGYPFLNKLNNTPYVVNLARAGKGNDYMFMETMSVIEQLKDINEKPELVIVQSSGVSRRLTTRFLDGEDQKGLERFHEDGSHLFYATPHDTDNIKELAVPPIGDMTTLFNLYSLQEYFKLNNIKYLFLNYFPFTDVMKKQFILNKLNEEHFVTFDDDCHMFDGWIDKMIKNKVRGEDDNTFSFLSRDREGHPTTPGYAYMFHRVLLKLNELYDMDYELIPSKKEIFKKPQTKLI